MIIKMKTVNVMATEEVIKILKDLGCFDIQIMRMQNKKFVIAVLGSDADGIDLKIFEKVFGVESVKRSNDFFVLHYAEFQEEFQFFQFFDKRIEPVGA